MSDTFTTTEFKRDPKSGALLNVDQSALLEHKKKKADAARAKKVEYEIQQMRGEIHEMKNCIHNISRILTEITEKDQ